MCAPCIIFQLKLQTKSWEKNRGMSNSYSNTSSICMFYHLLKKIHIFFLLLYYSNDNACIYYRQHGTRNFPLSYGSVIILSAIHRNTIDITVIAGARVHRDGGKTPVLFPKTTNGRWVSKQKWNCLGAIRKNIRGCLRRHRPFFSSAYHYGVRQIKLYFSAFVTNFFSWNSRWIARRATLNYHQTIGRFNIGRQVDIWIFQPENTDWWPKIF